MKYNVFCKKVKACIKFLEYCESLIKNVNNIKVVDESMLYGMLNEFEMKCLNKLVDFVDWYVEYFNKFHIQKYKQMCYSELYMLLLNPYSPDGVKQMYLSGWLSLFKRCYKPMKEAYKEAKETLPTNFVILNKLYERIQELQI